MANKLKYSIILLSLAFISCLENADLANMIVADQSVNDRYHSSQYWNEIHGFIQLEVSTDNYSILSFGDSHIGGTENLIAVLDTAVLNDNIALVMVGDITTGHEKDYQNLESILSNYNSLATFKTPGNHDLYFNGWEQYYPRFGSSFYYFTVKTPKATDIYYCLDTGSGTMGSLQFDWFKNHILENRKNYRFCGIYTHNNLFRFRRTTSTNPNVEEIRALLEVFTKYNVNVVVTGHDHLRDTEVFGNTTHIIMDALQDINRNASYFKLQNSDGKLNFSFIDL